MSEIILNGHKPQMNEKKKRKKKKKKKKLMVSLPWIITERMTDCRVKGRQSLPTIQIYLFIIWRRSYSVANVVS